MINKLKGHKAITLIALIITIIVLLILAGVVINMTLGNNGIINKAQGSTDLYKNAQEKEEWELAKAENRIDNYVDGSRDYAAEIKKLKERITELENMNSYSTTKEKIIGTWIDGKPIYKKVVNLSTSGHFSMGWNNNYAFLGSDIDTVVRLELRNKSANYSMLYSTVSSTGYLSTYQETGDAYGKPTFAIIEYTKTTDSVTANGDSAD